MFENVTEKIGLVAYTILYWNRNRSLQVAVRKCLLSFGAESFVFKVAIQKFKDKDI